MKNLKYIIVTLTVLLFVSVVSAGWFSATGNVVDGTAMNSAGTKCSDDDGGVFSGVVGTVVQERSFLKDKEETDTCSNSGKSVLEYYCSEHGKMKSKRIECPSGCLNGACKDSDSCSDVEGIVKDTNGKEFRDKCSGNDWIDFSCETDGTVKRTPLKCLAGCDVTAGGCLGACTGEIDTDDDPDVPGKLMAGSDPRLDECVEGNRVRQYFCDGLKVDSTDVVCGAGKICVPSSDGAYCGASAGAGSLGNVAETVAEVSGAVMAQTEKVEGLQRQINMLKSLLCVKDTTYIFCSEGCGGADADGDGDVDTVDFAAFRDGDSSADIDGSGTVEEEEHNILVANFGREDC